MFIRLSRLLGRWGGVGVPVAEAIYAPTRLQARQHVEQQRLLATPVPAPGGPWEQEGTRAADQPS